MLIQRLVTASVVAAVFALGACTDNQGINAATGALTGAAVGTQFGQGRGRTAATLAGAAVGTAIGANASTAQPTPMCMQRNPQTGETVQVPCPTR